MVNLSQKSQELLEFMRSDYIECGYMYSGSWPYTSLIERGFSKDHILELQNAGLIQKRDCDEYAFELSSAERGELITKHNLCSVWYEKKGDALLVSIQQEAQNAADIPHNKDTGFLTVSTLKSNVNHDDPDKVEVTCPFSIGQLIDLEYDLPRKLRWTGYNASKTSSGVKVGQFMVTNVVHNLMVYPRMNMLELQSLCDEFNKVHPDSRTMLLFEDIVLKRIKNKTSSLSKLIDSASTRTTEIHSKSQVMTKEPEPEI